MNGVIKGIPLARVQLSKCSTAYQTLLSEKKENGKEKKRRKKEDNSAWCDLPASALDCIPVGKCFGRGKGRDTGNCDVPFDCSF